MTRNILNQDNMIVRNGDPSDHIKIIGLMKDWWGGRDLTGLLLKQFFYHFRNTILIVESPDELIGFIMGYFSQTHLKEAYIHFVSINPNFRKMGMGRFLYEKFFYILSCLNCRTYDLYIITTYF